MKRIWLFRAAILFTCLSLVLVTSAQVKGNTLVDPSPHTWLQANIGGMGNINNISVSAMAVYNGVLYAGIYNPTQQPGTGGTIWKYMGGTNWVQVPTPGDTGTCDPTCRGFTTPFNYAVLGMKVFSNKLYVTTGWGGIMARVWRFDGANWEKVLEVSDISSNINGFTSLEVFNGMIFVGSSHINTDTPGARVYRSNTGNAGTWQMVVVNGLNDSHNFTITSLKTFGTYLYASVANLKSGLQVWRTPTGNGGDWAAVATNGFNAGSSQADPGGLAVFNNHLYLGVRNDTTGGGLYYTADGTNWTALTNNGFGRPANVKFEGLSSFGGFLYAFTNNPTNGMEVFVSQDGVSFATDSTGGFNSRFNHNPLWGSPLAEFNGQLFVGTSNYGSTILSPAEGGKIYAWTPIAPSTLTHFIFLPAASYH